MSVSIDQFINEAKLPSLPDLYIRLQSVLEDPDFSMADIVEVISQDPGITARLLRMVNSPYFGFVAKIDTVSRAVSMLGTQQVHDLVLATSVTQMFEGIGSDVMDMAVYWRNSVFSAVTSRLLAGHCNLLDEERLFISGLLCDIGHLPMYQSLPEISQQALQRAEQEEKPLYRIERELLGFDYAQVGGLLMQKWSLPKSLWEVIRYHTNPAAGQHFPLETAIVHIASLFSSAARKGLAPDQWLTHVDPVALQKTGLKSEAIIAIRPEVDEQMDVAVNLIFNGVVSAA